MADVDRLLHDFIEADRDAPADPMPYLERLEGVDRAELEALIDGYLARAPRRPFDAAAFERSPARAVAEDLGRSLGGVSGTWPALLPRLRHRARLRRSDVVQRLAQELHADAGRSRRSRATTTGWSRERSRRRWSPTACWRRSAASSGRPPTGCDGPARTWAAAWPDPPSPARSRAWVARPGARRPGDAPGRAAPPPPEPRDEIDELFTGLGCAMRDRRGARRAGAGRGAGLHLGRRAPAGPVEDLVDSVYGLLVHDVEDMRAAPGAPSLAEGQSLSGLLLPARGEIWVNAEEARKWPPRRRFTIGHELGHWVMHRDGQQALFCRRTAVDEGRRRPARDIEEEASAFAAALLMPQWLFVREHARAAATFRPCAPRSEPRRPRPSAGSPRSSVPGRDGRAAGAGCRRRPRAHHGPRSMDASLSVQGRRRKRGARGCG